MIDQIAQKAAADDIEDEAGEVEAPATREEPIKRARKADPFADAFEAAEKTLDGDAAPKRKAVPKSPARKKVAGAKPPRPARAAPPSKTVAPKTAAAKAAPAKAAAPKLATPSAAPRLAAPKPREPKPRDRHTVAQALAQRILKLTASDTVDAHLSELYTEDCVSREADGTTVEGLDALTEKMELWSSMAESTSMRARHVVVQEELIVIEWEGTVKMRDGREALLCEIAVHELRGGKIAAERYYYDPSTLAPPTARAAPEPLPSVNPPRGTPPLDPLDL